MKIDVLFSPLQADELFFTGKNTIVIDVLRATSVISTAVNNGAREVIPVNTVEAAMKLSGNFNKNQMLLGGERNTKKIEGFHLGNSPLEYSTEAISGKSIILFTTNGSKAIVKAKHSENIFICSFVNLFSVVAYLSEIDKDIEIICAGKEGKFCIEDTICAGRLISEVLKNKSNIELTDSASVSIVLNNHYGNDLNRSLHECEHGKLLIQNGFEEDVNFCAQVGIIDNLPFFSGGTIKDYNQSLSPAKIKTKTV